MTTDMYDDRIELCSLREASELLKRPLAQVQTLSASHALGTEYVTNSGATFYREAEIRALAAAAHLSKADVLNSFDNEQFASPRVVVLRQRGPQPEEGHGRTWYGYDHRADHSGNVDLQRQQDDASRMWWPVNAANREYLAHTNQRGDTIPLIISVGGLVVGAREITGIDEDPALAHGRLVAFAVRPAGDWADRLRGSWLNSGAGKAILWWTSEGESGKW